ncbi:MAG: type III polyketide synthase [Leptospirales bacterium]|nr:type III polyketide synthase [Leptospirales bacterium]
MSANVYKNVSTIAATQTALPPYEYTQDQLISEFRNLWAEKYFNVDRIEQFHRNVMVGSRHLALPIESYQKLKNFSQSNDAYISAALEISERLIRDLLKRNDFPAEQISAMISTSVTGLAVPSLDARLMNRIPFAPSLKRTPIFGLGCMGGAAGISRAADYLRGHPKDSVLFVSVELCSLTLQREDLSIANIVSSGLFGDGAAAVLLLGEENLRRETLPGPQILANRSVFFPNTEHVMGWDIGETGFKVVLDPGVPEFAREHLKPGVVDFLKEEGLTLDDISVWIAHPGGPKVITGMEEGLGLKPGTLRLSNESLLKYGNLSSASVLFILKETLATHPPPGSLGLLIAMGPAFASELILIRW